MTVPYHLLGASPQTLEGRKRIRVPDASSPDLRFPPEASTQKVDCKRIERTPLCTSIATTVVRKDGSTSDQYAAEEGGTEGTDPLLHAAFPSAARNTARHSPKSTRDPHPRSGAPASPRTLITDTPPQAQYRRCMKRVIDGTPGVGAARNSREKHGRVAILPCTPTRLSRQASRHGGQFPPATPVDGYSSSL